MARSDLVAVLDYIQRIRPSGGRDETDRQLLNRFARRREEDAFFELVRRHGPLVLGVCRRLLGRTQDVEDAFQATFFVLARHASSRRWHDSIAGWLHQVARHVALKAREVAKRRMQHERQAGALQNSTAGPDKLRELGEVLDQELQSLPERLRAPLLLCYLEGLSRDAAAEQLGWSRRTLQRRLDEGRDTLRQRLLRKGLTLSAVGLAAELTGRASAAIPMSLVRTVAKAAIAYAADGGVATLGTSASALTLAQASLRALLLAKLQGLTSTGLLVAAILAGTAIAAYSRLDARTDSTPLASDPPAAITKPVASPAKNRDDAGAPLPEGAIARLGTTRFRHGGWIDSLAVSPDGKTIASAGSAPTQVVRLWDASTGREIRRLGDHSLSSASISVCFSPDGRVVAAAGRPWQEGKPGRMAIYLWDAGAGKELGVLRDDEVPQDSMSNPRPQVSFSPDGKLVGLASSRLVTLWEVATLKPVRTKEIRATSCFGPVLFSPDNKVLARCTLADNGSNGEIHLLDVSTLTEVRLIQLRGLDGLCPTIAFSPDGKLLASSGTEAIFVIDVATGRVLHRFAAPTSRAAPAFSPDGKYLAANVGEQLVKIWDLATEAEVCQITRFTGWVNSIAFLPDGRALATAGQDGTVHLWDAKTGAPRDALRPADGHTGPVNSAVFMPDGQTLATAGDDGVTCLWRLKTGEVVQRLSNPRCGTRSLAVSPDGKLLAAGGYDGTTHLWEVVTGRHLQELTGHAGKAVGGIAFAPGSDRIATADRDGAVNLWDLPTGRQLRSYTGGSDSMLGPFFSPDGKWLAAAVQPRSRTLVQGAKSIPLGPQFGPVIVWDAETGRELRRFAKDHGRTLGVSLSSDGRTLAAACQDGTIVLWDPETGRVRAELAGEANSAYGVALSPDGHWLAAAGSGETVRLWEVLTGKVARQYAGTNPYVRCVAFARDGRRFATGGNDTNVLIWDATGRGSVVAGTISAAELDRLWTDLAALDAPRAHRAFWVLADAPAQAVSMCRQRLRPANHPDLSKLDGYLADLDSDEFAARTSAEQSLIKMAGDAESVEAVERALRRIAESAQSLEARTRAQHLLENLRDPVPGPELLRALRAVGILEQIASPAAIQVLQTLASGATEAPLTRHAKSALQRISSATRGAG